MKRLNCFCLALILALTSTARADLIYSFDQSNYDVAPNGTVDIQVFLQQIGTAGDPVDLSLDGLISGSVQVVFNDNPPSDPAQVVSELDITPSLAWDDTLLGPEFEIVPGVSAAFVDGVDDVLSPIVGTRILLGAFTFTAGNQPSETTTIRAQDWRGFDDTIGGNFVSLDGAIGTATATITTAAVPEPSACILLAISAGWATLLRRRS